MILLRISRAIHHSLTGMIWVSKVVNTSICKLATIFFSLPKTHAPEKIKHSSLENTTIENDENIGSF